MLIERQGFPPATSISRQRKAWVTKFDMRSHDADRQAAWDAASVTARAPTTPDGRYFLIAGQLWRSTNPAIPEDIRQRLVDDLMDARRAVKEAKAGRGDIRDARAAVHAAKVALGERGPVWWDDGSPDYNRLMAKNTPYADWAIGLRS